ncbi:MAG: fatty acid desaturase family protein [Hyphomicrobiales bacterium]|nr:fatty acid desaturase family protein [Hyphomicrobiales bacterium]
MTFAARLPVDQVLTPDQLATVRARPTWRGLWMIAHAWATIVAAIALVAWLPNPLAFVIAVMVIGSRQLGLGILMHEGAHGCLSPDHDLNDRLSQWLCAYPIFAETRAYRRYHLKHHKRTQQSDDPDLVLSAPFPITAKSYRRKFLRDLLGKTGYSQRKAQVLNALGDPALPLPARLALFRERLGRQILVNAVIFALMTLCGVWWAYPLLWLLPLTTWYMVVTRIRNIAEHAVVPDHDDPLRNTRTTKAGLIERLFVAPYFVNYHLEHHLLYYVPCYNLPKVHAMLRDNGLLARMEVQPDYRAVMRMATAKPANEDRPGALVNNARRMRAGARVDSDNAAAGF